MTFDKQKTIQWAIPVLIACIKTNLTNWKKPNKEINQYLIELEKTLLYLCDYITSTPNHSLIIRDINEVLNEPQNVNSQKKLLKIIRTVEPKEISNEIDSILFLLHHYVGGILEYSGNNIQIKILEHWSKSVIENNVISSNLEKAAAISVLKLQQNGDLKNWKGNKKTKPKNKALDIIITYLSAISYSLNKTRPNTNTKKYIIRIINNLSSYDINELDSLCKYPDWYEMLSPKPDKIWLFLGITTLIEFCKYFKDKTPTYEGGNGIWQRIKNKTIENETLISIIASDIPTQLFD